MFRYFWLYFVAALGLLVSLEVQAQGPDSAGASHSGPVVQGGTESQRNSQNTSGQSRLLETRTPGTPDESETTQQREDRAEEREQSDLKAQWAAANAAQEQAELAFWQFWIGLAGTFVATVGTVAVISTLKLNRRSVALAQLSADASLKAAQAATEAVHAERAWITNLGSSLGTIGNFQSPAEQGQIHAWSIGLRWQNDGRSPAIKVSTRLHHQLLDQPAIPVFHQTEPTPNGTILGPGREFDSSGLILSDEVFQKVMREEMFLVLYGRVDYNDVFSATRRHTEGCFAVTVTVQGRRNGEMEPTLTLIPIGPQNTAS